MRGQCTLLAAAPLAPWLLPSVHLTALHQTHLAVAAVGGPQVRAQAAGESVRSGADELRAEAQVGSWAPHGAAHSDQWQQHAGAAACTHRLHCTQLSVFKGLNLLILTAAAVGRPQHHLLVIAHAATLPPPHTCCMTLILAPPCTHPLPAGQRQGRG
jgi:hypothetical protein